MGILLDKRLKKDDLSRISFELRNNNGVTGKLVLTVVITCIGSSFLIGYNLGVLNLPRRVSDIH
ncbi:unnamed protein product [Schistosoma margrebowiei]|uniref:Uncharacterized protein n=1 Tax=Schistosoma margrebowiei TaxID=48269 RepID=A0A183N9T0_9TREM|nr:unnamed protein product [Schistosoma margrebowiei]